MANNLLIQSISSGGLLYGAPQGFVGAGSATEPQPKDTYIPPCDQTPNPTKCKVTEAGIYTAGGVMAGGMIASGGLSVLGAEEAARNLFLLSMISSMFIVVGTVIAIVLIPNEAH